MPAPCSVVRLFLDTTAPASTTFLLNDPVQGVLDSGSYFLGGDVGTTVDGVEAIVIDRGSPSLVWEETPPGNATIVVDDWDRRYDSLNASSPHAGSLKPGKRVQIDTAGVRVFDGFTSRFSSTYDGRRTITTIECEDALAILARKQFDEWTATPGQTAGPRLTAILNRADVAWNGGARDLDIGLSTLQGDTISWGSSVLNYAQLVAKSDLGSLFASRTGLITFRDRHANLGGAADVVLTDDGSGVEFNAIATRSGSETFFTRVSVDREGGLAQTAVVGSEQDGIRSLSVTGLLMDSDAQSADMASYLAAVYATGEPIISGVSVDVADEYMTAGQISSVLALDLTSLARIVLNPAYGSPIDQTTVVIGIRHDIGPVSHGVSLRLGKHDGRQPFILSDSELGALDGVGVLSF